MTLDPDALGASLQRLIAHDRGPDADLLASLQDVADACVDLFGVSGSGVMLADEVNVIRYVAASDGHGRWLEEVEASTGQGPCTDAFVFDHPVSCTDLREESRWPEFRAELDGDPALRAVMGIPIDLGAVPVGTLDIYLDRPHEWSAEEQDALLRYSKVAQSMLTAALEAHAAGEQVEQLQYALDYRVVIERGVGYLMARDDLGAVAAFDKLRTAARSTRTKIGQVAQQLLDTGRLPD